MLLLLLLSCFSRVRLCASPWTAAYQAPPSVGFSRQEYWSGVPLPSPLISTVSLLVISSVPMLTSVDTALYLTFHSKCRPKVLPFSLFQS